MRLSHCFLALVLSIPAWAQAPSAATQRLVAVGRLWSRVKWTHPALARTEVDWDRALAQALPGIQAARSQSELITALQTLMAPLNDPALRVSDRPAALFVEAPADSAPLTWLPEDVALLHLHWRDPMDPWNPAQADVLKAIAAATPRAKAFIFDLRPASQEGPGSEADAFLKARAGAFISRPIQLPSIRYRYHSGFKPELGTTSGGYFSGWLTPEAEVIRPSKSARPLPMVFIVNEGSGIPLSALALQQAGCAWIVAEGPPSLAWAAPVESAPIEGGLSVEFSTGDLVFANGTAGFGVDAATAPSATSESSTPSIAAARELIHGHTRPGSTLPASHAPGAPVEGTATEYPATTFPDLPWRQLAVIKFWSVADAFFPYKHLMDRPWDESLPMFLDRMQTVSNGQEYALALAEMATWLEDSHVGVRNAELNAYMGQAPALVRLAYVEGQIAVSGTDSGAMPGLAPGDIILGVDGEEAQLRLQRMKKVITASNEAARIRAALRTLLSGPEGSLARVEAKGADGQVKTFDLPRQAAYWAKLRQKREGPVIRTLANQVVYADLDRLEPKDVDGLFETAKNAAALVLDMRGYPRGTAWSLAPRLNVKGAKVGAAFRRNVVISMPSEGALSLAFDQELPKTDRAPYRGKVVMLINEDTISQAEHTALFLEAACDLTLVGSPTTGANGDVTMMLLPGSIRVSFTGHDVRHADGRQLQRTGLQPHISATPTLVGLRAGQDEVLDRALAFLRTGR